MKVAGGHPFLVQVAASALWEAYEDEEGDPTLRREQARQKFHDGATLILRDMWRRWSPAARRAFAAVALTHINSLEKRESPLKQRAFYVERLIRDTRDFESELRLLSRARLCDGKKTQLSPAVGGSSSSLPLVVGRRTSTHGARRGAIEEWLQKQELGLLLTRGEKEQLGKAVRAVGELLRDGVST